MSAALEPRNTPSTPARTVVGRAGGAGPLRIGLINNMPDSALQSTEAQFCALLEAASGSERITVRLSSFPELPRGADALARIESAYWPLEQLLGEGLDALVVTGTEPRAPLLSDEPYWHRFGQLLDYAERRTHASIWSCLAAHAAVETLDGIRRQRRAEKRSGVYEHHILGGHPLLQGVGGPLRMPHSRWNELPLRPLREAGYTLLSWSDDSGADAFVRHQDSLMLFFQGHPEYEGNTLLKEYRRDVGRYLNRTQEHYPTLPVGYLSTEATATMESFRRAAVAERRPELLERFPFAEVNANLHNTWQAPAVAIYRNWLAHIQARRREATRLAEPVSLR
ncbi:MAG TPA: homoserine O-succinyltransferase [Steroidobacteraceae bacterium]|nr:homoserine O-succinyltransferase [Steroidobacteraceae bacterium]